MRVIQEMVLQDELLQVFEHIFKAFGFRASLLDSNFREVAPLRAHPPSTYCSHIQQRPEKLEECRENDRRQCFLAEQEKSTRYYRCHAGLMEAVFPLFFENRCIGFIIVGQFRLNDGVPSELLALETIRDGKKLRATFEELPVYDPGKLESILKLIEINTRYLMEHRIVSVKQNILTEEIITFIRENIRKNPGLKEISEAVHRSPSTVNHTLKAVSGKCYKQLQISIKLKEAEKLLSEQTLSVSEVAAAVGFEDPLYFSRRFRKEYGLSPLGYRQNFLEAHRKPTQ